MRQSRSHQSQPGSPRRSARQRCHTTRGNWNIRVSEQSTFQMHDRNHHIPATEAFGASHAGPGAARAVVRDGALSDGGSVSDLKVVLEAMGELVAVSKAASGVRDGGNECREGDHQDLSSVSHARSIVDGALFVYHEEVHFCGRLGGKLL
jgi:hypothetical protein